MLEVSRSHFYAQRGRAKPVACPIRIELRSIFAASCQSYGSRRLTAALKAKGFAIGRTRVRRLMREDKLVSCWKRRTRPKAQYSSNTVTAPNILARQFNPPGPNQAYVTDLTYIPTQAGWAYLAVVLDCYSRKIVGFAIDHHMQAELVCKALRMTIAHRKPQPGTIVHSDQGSQYASSNYQTLLRQHGLIGSMSRKGNCWDNAVVERFFCSLKTERVKHTRYLNLQHAQHDISQYIVNFYNSQRIHSTLNQKAPNQFERLNPKPSLTLSGNT